MSRLECPTPNPEEVSYSREATIVASTDYYTFLTRLYMNESQIIHPHAEGWSIVNADPGKLQDLGKSDEVLSMLAHLPYIRCPGNWHHDADAIPGSSSADWPDLITLRVQGWIIGEELPGCTEAFIALDTELGITHWEKYTCPEDIGENWMQVDWEELKKDVSKEDANWRYSAAAWAIPDFFEVLKDEFRSLNRVPISPYTVHSSKEELHNEVGMMSMLKDIYRRHGWPDLAAYRKSKCTEAIRKAMVERYPESACS
ncbi:hypothetical protein N657DRAFT_684489 [Parathielavia appendiculata]|uniref:Uncharacterized protein n=1 Tax=Parathielavia appendiculata TaxID=2587402 RepID=A0AAN6TRK0_9PEZI|nr:hypothetical protein N657DRAFT_684489 [Parathielavia appendiculata]